MPINMSSLVEVAPPVVNVETPASARIDIQGVQTSEPTAAKAQFLDPLSGAGVELTRWVLLILAAVLLIILGNLVYDQKVFSNSTRDAFKSAVAVNQPANAIHSLSPQLRIALIPVRDELRGISPESPQKATHESLRKIIAQLERLELEYKDARSNDELKKLVSATRTLNGSDDSARVDPSAALPIRHVIENLIDPSASSITADTLLAKKDLLNAYAAAAQSTRDFWMQVSQMILINLLLPVLTALLGYVFASKANK